MKNSFCIGLVALALTACGDSPPAKDASSVDGDNIPEGPAADGAPATDAFKHGSKKGPGDGGGAKEAKGEKEGAGGFKHGSAKGPGDGGGAKDGSGAKTAGKADGHGKGKGDGKGGGAKDGKGEQSGVMKK